VGLQVGITEGVKVGFTEGLAVGEQVGTNVGLAVGSAVPVNGFTDGTIVGLAEGDRVVGTAVGMATGAPVGVRVGLAVGTAVGTIGHVLTEAMNIAPLLRLRALVPHRLGISAEPWYTSALYWSLLGYQLALDTVYVWSGIATRKLDW
jgi:hypothetical protein